MSVMKNNTQFFFDQPVRGEWVRLRTFIYLRWLAVFGQSGAVVAGLFFLNLDLKLALISSLILLSASINIVATFLFPENKRLSEKDILQLLLYDLIQLGLLLFLTGGLTNPFSVLVLAPVTISATALRIVPTIILGSVAVFIISSLGFFYLPLETRLGERLDPEILLLGTWLSLLITVIFLASYARRVIVEMTSMSEALLATQMALEREQKLTALGGVVAAMAHELGTPLSTIKLVSSEILSDPNISNEMNEDIKLINMQVDRCRDILHDMGRRGKDDTHVHTAPILTLIQEAIEPHQNRGKKISLHTEEWAGDIFDDVNIVKQPTLYRRSEIIHGIRNLVQNAVDFAEKKVNIYVEWNEFDIRLAIHDDGMGFPTEMLGRLGDPFINKRIPETSFRKRAPEYQGMGLGLFIAKTLLERTGAKIFFSNGKGQKRSLAIRKANNLPSPKSFSGGALVEVIWPTDEITVDEDKIKGPLAPNTRN